MIRLKVEGMTCGHCVASVKKALERVPGAGTVEVHLDSGEATVQGGADPSALIGAVQGEGYRAEVMP